jgi:glycosyltransferase involved in cell wall biosynthesis
VNATRTAWVCCQLGAREHYAVPRALHRSGRLAHLLTDAWAPAGSLKALGRLGQRHHDDLDSAPVTSLTGSLILHELLWRAQGRRDWDYFIARNQWFQSLAAAQLPASRDGERTLVFAHSYAAAGIFREAKRRQWTTVLGQIDPGPEHYAIQERLVSARPEYRATASSPPARYFDHWRQECELAEWIVVNSPWSRDRLMRAGVPERKIRILPLPYAPPPDAAAFARDYPEVFSARRPLRVLFVGTASVTKGVPEILESIEQLAGLPIELRLVGDRAITVPDRFGAQPGIQWVGPVDRATVMKYYRSSDVLVFPSHSDGYGMAQIEAQAWTLPIIASTHCGAVVRDDETGILLDEISSNALAAALRRVIESPGLLVRYSQNARRFPAATMATLAEGLAALERS